MDKNEELQKWLSDDRYIRAQDLMMTLNMDNRQVTRLLKKHKIHAAKRIYIGRHIDGRHLGQFAFFDKNQCLAFLEKWENGYDKHIFMSLNDICDTFNTNASVVKAFLKRNKIKKCEMHRDANNYRIALYDKQIITMLWTAERGLLQNLQPNPDLCKISELEILFKISDGHVRRILRLYNIKPIRKNPSAIPDLYCKKQCIDSISSFNIQKKSEHYDNDTLNQLLTNPKYITTTELENEFGVSRQKINYIFRKKGIAPLKKIYTPHGLRAFYDRAECERARQFINKPEKKEVKKVEEKQMELPEPKEQTPDIIPADTIDLFTMSELEAELKNRGVELTAEVRAKINASDMPEMQHIATMLCGDTKTIAIRLSVLNEIAGQLAGEIKNISEEKTGLFIGALFKNCTASSFYLDKELKPCPFCGMNSIVIDCEEISTGYWVARLQCSNCEVKLELDDSTKEIAADLLINQWNERPRDEDFAKTKAGAKSKYKPEFDEIAFDMASANKTDAEIGKALNISIDTFYRYKKTISSFAEALDRGRAANPFAITDSQGRERSNRYFELKDFMEMQKQLNDMQKMIEMLSKKLDGVGVVEKKIYMKNNKVDKVIVTETKLEDKK